MSSNVTETKCCNNCLDGFIKSFPTLSKSSKSVAKVAIAYAAMTASIAVIIAAMVVVNNPDLISITQWHWTQITYVTVAGGTAILSLITWCFFSCVHGRRKEKAYEKTE